jgi:hypothetical protein
MNNQGNLMESSETQHPTTNKQTIVIDDHFKVERTTTKRPDDGVVVFFDELFLN